MTTGIGGAGGGGGFGGGGGTGPLGFGAGGNGGTAGGNGGCGCGCTGAACYDSPGSSAGANTWATATMLPLAAGTGGAGGPAQWGEGRAFGGNGGLVILTYTPPDGVCRL
jgi:hypothetical protein